MIMLAQHSNTISLEAETWLIRIAYTYVLCMQMIRFFYGIGVKQVDWSPDDPATPDASQVRRRSLGEALPPPKTGNRDVGRGWG